MEVEVSNWNSQPSIKSFLQSAQPSAQEQVGVQFWQVPSTQRFWHLLPTKCNVPLGSQRVVPQVEESVPVACCSSAGFPSSMPHLFKSVQVLVWVKVSPQVIVEGSGCQSVQNQSGMQAGVSGSKLQVSLYQYKPAPSHNF